MSSSDIDTFEGSKLKKVLRESAVKGEHDELNASEEDDNSEATLLIPILSLSIIILITVSLALFRLFYTKCYKDKQETNSRYVIRNSISKLTQNNVKNTLKC